jgi:hypothetical protein
LGVIVPFERAHRKTMRFPLQTPVAFWWTDENGESQHGEGHSRDISEHGAFVLASVCPPVGASVGLKIDLEALPNAPGTLPIEFQGQVIRVEQPHVEKGSRGFAVCRRPS